LTEPNDNDALLPIICSSVTRILPPKTVNLAEVLREFTTGIPKEPKLSGNRMKIKRARISDAGAS
jgi:hypothetical protein